MIYISDSVFEAEKCVGMSFLFSCKLIFSLRYFNTDLTRWQGLLNPHSPLLFKL